MVPEFDRSHGCTRRQRGCCPRRCCRQVQKEQEKKENKEKDDQQQQSCTVNNDVDVDPVGPEAYRKACQPLFTLVRVGGQLSSMTLSCCQVQWCYISKKQEKSVRKPSSLSLFFFSVRTKAADRTITHERSLLSLYALVAAEHKTKRTNQ